MNTSVSALQPGISLSRLVSARVTENRLTVPVSQSIAPYAQFKHVKGVPSSGAGYPLSKLQVLDILIDRLKSIKGNGANDVSELKEDSSRPTDSLIQEYSQKLHGIFVAADTNPYLAPGSPAAVTLNMHI